jgi:hypothetical protein
LRTRPARRIDPQRAAQLAAIAAQQEMRLDPPGRDALTKIERNRGLARPARRGVAAADHRHRRLPAGPTQAPRGRPAIERGRGGKQGRP